MSVATGDVGASHLPHMHHARLMTFYVKITILYAISTHKNSVIIYLKCINMTLKICHHYMAVFAVKSCPTWAFGFSGMEWWNGLEFYLIIMTTSEQRPP